MSSYLHTVEEVYAAAATNPDADLCCTRSPLWNLPDLHIPPSMVNMNYGCGSTVDPRDLKRGDTILYIGVGGGLEALQFAYFTRRPGSVIAVDPVGEMREKARANLAEAASHNAWFHPDYVTILEGSVFDLPVPSNHVPVITQNCLFNVFAGEDLDRALAEVVRVLKPWGVFSTSDPISPTPLPAALVNDERLRARCISGCRSLEDYLKALTDAGLGKVEVRSRIPYRYLHPNEYAGLTAPIMLESIEVAAFKVPEGPDGASIFMGRTATYFGSESYIEDGLGNRLLRGIPSAVSEAAAVRLARIPDIFITEPTFHCKSGGCC